MDANSQSLISFTTENITEFVVFWVSLQEVSQQSYKKKVNLEASDLLSLWDDTTTQPGDVSNSDATVPLGTKGKELLSLFYNSEADVESFLENVELIDSNEGLNENEYLRLKLVLDLKDFYEGFSDGIRQTYFTIVDICKNSLLAKPSLNLLLDFDENQWDTLVRNISLSYQNRSGEKKLSVSTSASNCCSHFVKGKTIINEQYRLFVTRITESRGSNS